jgi:hypothetical protein
MRVALAMASNQKGALVTESAWPARYESIGVIKMHLPARILATLS